ncbi:MAG: homoserine O-succinyltransferase [Fibrobacterales bacterium]
MKLALLKCDTVVPELIGIDGDYDDLFTHAFHSVSLGVTIDTFNVHAQEYPIDYTTYDAFVISGASASAYDDLPWIHRLEEYIEILHATEQILIGICFGHQIIAQALGGVVIQSDKGWGVGSQDVAIHSNEQWMFPKADSFAIPLSHRDQVETLPQDAKCIGSNEFCPHSVFTMRNTLCFQGHPEYSIAYATALYNLRKKSIGIERVESGIRSLHAKHDNLLVLSWIIEFIRISLKS